MKCSHLRPRDWQAISTQASCIAVGEEQAAGETGNETAQPDEEVSPTETAAPEEPPVNENREQEESEGVRYEYCSEMTPDAVHSCACRGGSEFRPPPEETP